MPEYLVRSVWTMAGIVVAFAAMASLALLWAQPSDEDRAQVHRRRQRMAEAWAKENGLPGPVVCQDPGPVCVAGKVAFQCYAGWCSR